MELRTILTAVMATSLAVANIVASKILQFTIPVVGSVTVSAGFFGIAVAFFTTDVVSELYGKETARTIVNSSILSLGVAWLSVFVAVFSPAAPFYELAQPFNQIFMQSGSVIAASITTLFLSQNLDVFLFHEIKQRFAPKYFRNIGSTVVSQAVDTFVFTMLAFVVFPTFLGGTVIPLTVAWSIFVAEYIVKGLVVVFDTPLFYLATWGAKNE